MKLLAVIGAGAVLAGATLYAAFMAATVTIWATLWSMAGWAR